MARCGWSPLEWQQDVLDVAGETDADGRLRYRIVVVVVQRRAGKTRMTLGGTHLHRAATRPRQSSWWAAQSYKDGLAIWKQQVGRDLGDDRLRRALGVRNVRRAAAQETVEFRNGSTVGMFTPAERSLHGLSNHLVTLDEARFHDTETGSALMSAVVPGLSDLSNDGQLWVVSSAGTSMSGFLLELIRRGREGEPGMAYFEWGIPDDADPSDLDTVAAYHPGFGRTLDLAALRSAQSTMAPEDFAREFAGRFTVVDESLIRMDLWNELVDTERRMPQPRGLAIGFDAHPDRSASSVSAAWRDDSGNLQTALLDSRPGVDWLADRIVELVRRWRPGPVWFDNAGPAVGIADELRRRRVRVEPLMAAQYAAACQQVFDAIEGRALYHHPEPLVDVAAAGVAKRPLGERWVWGRRQSSVDVSPLTSLTCAVWGYDHRPRPPMTASR
jgi:hypothetical protein